MKDLIHQAIPFLWAGVCLSAIWKRQWLTAGATFFLCLLSATQFLQNKVIDQILGYALLAFIPLFCVALILDRKQLPITIPRWIWLLFMVIWFMPAAKIPVVYRTAILLAVIFAYVFRPRATDAPGEVRWGAKRPVLKPPA